MGMAQEGLVTAQQRVLAPMRTVSGCVRMGLVGLGSREHTGMPATRGDGVWLCTGQCQSMRVGVAWCGGPCTCFSSSHTGLVDLQQGRMPWWQQALDALIAGPLTGV